MPRLDDLRKSILHMTDDELRELHTTIRNDRKIKKEAPKAKRQRADRSIKVRSQLEGILDSMSAEDRAKFLRELEA